MRVASSEFADDPCSSVKRGTMVRAARALLSAVTRLLILADMADVMRLLAHLKIVCSLIELSFSFIWLVTLQQWLWILNSWCQCKLAPGSSLSSPLIFCEHTDGSKLPDCGWSSQLVAVLGAWMSKIRLSVVKISKRTHLALFQGHGIISVYYRNRKLWRLLVFCLYLHSGCRFA